MYACSASITSLLARCGLLPDQLDLGAVIQPDDQHIAADDQNFGQTTEADLLTVQVLPSGFAQPSFGTKSPQRPGTLRALVQTGFIPAMRLVSAPGGVATASRSRSLCQPPARRRRIIVSSRCAQAR